MSLTRKTILVAVVAFFAGVAGLRCAQVYAPISVAQAAVGDVTDLPGYERRAVELLAATTATNSPPTSNAGLDLNTLKVAGRYPDRAALVIASTAGSGTMTVTVRLWGKLPVASGLWVPLGPGADATKGVLNLEAAIGETGADAIRHSEVIENLLLFERLYVEVTAIGGTSTSVTAWLVAKG
jgi:hypothetical protein